MKENLDVGTMINGTTESSNNSTIEKYCYNNDPANCNTYGGLYQWNEAMQYDTTSGSQGICPVGWHLPTVAELQILAVIVNHDGNALKAIGQGAGNGSGTNASGFSALQAGYRDNIGNWSGDLGLNAYFWNSSEINTSNANYNYLNYGDSHIGFVSILKDRGFSIRCLMDDVPPIPGSIGGNIYFDQNGNGVKDVIETGLSNWKVRISGVKTDSMVTDVNGNYLFDSLHYGTYTVTEVVQNGWSQVTPSGSGYSFNLLNGQDTTSINFGNFHTPYIRGVMYKDTQQDSSIAGDSTRSGWVVKLYKAGLFQSRSVSDGSGNYAFTVPSGGTFTVEESLAVGWKQTYPRLATPGVVTTTYGANAGTRAYSITITSGMDTSGFSFGNYQHNTLAIQKFIDNDGNIATMDDRTPKSWGLKLYKDSVSSSTLIDSVDSGLQLVEYDLAAGTYIAVEADSAGWNSIAKVHNGVQVSSSARLDTFTYSNELLYNVQFINYRPNRITVKNYFDLDGNFSTTNDRSGRRWSLTLYRDAISPANIVGSASSAESLTVGNLAGGTYIAVEADSSGWTHMGRIINGVPEEGSFNNGSLVASGGNSTIAFVNTSSFVTLRNFRDNDANFATSNDRVPEPWGLTLYRNEISPAAIVASVSSSESLVVNNLAPGTYIAIEADVAGWTHLGTILDGIGAANSINQLTFHVVGNESHVIDFVNVALGNILVRTYKDLDSNFATTDDRSQKRWHLAVYRDSISPAKLVGQVSSDFSLNIYNPTPGKYIAVESDSSGWKNIGKIVNGVAKAGNYSTDTIIYSSGQSITVDFINSQPISIGIKRLSLTVHDGSNAGARSLIWGTRQGATYGIFGVDNNATMTDQDEGEYELPPALAGIFDTRFVDPRGGIDFFGDGSWTDIRGFVDVAQADTYKVTFQPGPSGYPITVRWSKQLVQSSYNGTVTLSGQYGGATDMKTKDSLVISDTRITSLLLIARSPNLKVFFGRGWNLVSLPVTVNDASVHTLYPNANSQAFYFTATGGYNVEDSLQVGTGYWLKFQQTEFTYSINGTPITSNVIPVESGWNIIGSLHSPVLAGSITSIPTGIIMGQFYGYYRGYQIVDTLEPYKGYWIKVGSNGQLLMNATGRFAKKTYGTLSQQRNDNLTVQDINGNKQTLYFAIDAISENKNTTSELPPIPPAGIFDARFETNNLVEITEEGKMKEIPIQISSAEYPVTISWEVKTNATLLVDGKEIRMQNNGTIQITNSKTQIALRFGNTGNEEKPKTFALEQNYPNPFNPLTIINYQLTIGNYTTLKIYNTLGQEIATLVDGMQDAGYKSIQWDASSVPTGVYFYKLNSGAFTDVKKMLLIR